MPLCCMYTEKFTSNSASGHCVHSHFTLYTLHTPQQLLQLVITDIAIVLVTWNSVFQYSNKGLLFFWLLSVSLAIIAFCFLVATFFSRAKVSTTCDSPLSVKVTCHISLFVLLYRLSVQIVLCFQTTVPYRGRYVARPVDKRSTVSEGLCHYSAVQ
jgi:hypothetical protein